MSNASNAKVVRDRRISSTTPTHDNEDQRPHRIAASLSWRPDLLNNILKVAAVAGLLLTGLVIAFRAPPRFDAATYVVMSAAGLVLALRLLPQLPFKLRAFLTVMVIYSSGLPTVLRSGFALSSGAVLLAAIVLAILLLGRGPAVLLLVITAVVLVALGMAARRGHFVAHPIESDPRIARNWFRMAIGFDLVAATLMTIVGYAVRHIEMNFAETSSALALLTGEQRRRAGLESQRQRADGDWHRSACELTVLEKNEDVETGNTGAAFRAIAEAGARGMGAERCGIWLFDETRAEMACHDLYERSPDRHRRDLVLSVAAAPAFFAALQSERSIAAHRAKTDARTRELEPAYLSGWNVVALLAAPIRLGNRVVGMVCGEQLGAAVAWGDAQLSFAGSLAELAARVLAAAQRTSRVLAVRASTEEVAEILDALKIRLAGIPSGLDSREMADDPQSLAIVEGLIGKVRRLSSDLRLPSLEEVGLVPALRAYVDGQSAASGVAIEFQASYVDGSEPREREVACFWIVQEAIANILDRADAQLVSVHLERQDLQLRIVIEDDGRNVEAGLAAPTGPWRRAPLARVRQRARALGGDLTVNSCPGAGTIVEVSLPSESAFRNEARPQRAAASAQGRLSPKSGTSPSGRQRFMEPIEERA